MKAFHRLARGLLLFMNRLPGGLAFTRLLYHLVAHATIALLRRKGVVAFYVRGSLGKGNAIPGMSDIDIHVIIGDMDDPAYAAFTAGISARLARLKRAIPILGVYVDSVRDLEVATRSCTLYFVTPGEEWVRYAGRDVIQAPAHPPGRLLLAWTKLLYRRYIGFQKRYFGGTVFGRGRRFLKLNENLLLDAARLLHLLDTGATAPVASSGGDIAAAVRNPQLSRLLDLNDAHKEKHYAVDGATFYDETFREWYGLLKGIAARIDPAKIAATGSWAGYRMTPLSLPPETLSTVRGRLEPFVSEVRSATAGLDIALVLSAVPNKNYNYKTCVVVREEASIEEIFDLKRRLHACFGRCRATFPHEYLFSFGAPLILSEGMFRQAALCEKGGLEPFYFRKHGETLFSTLGRPLPAMDETAAIPSFLSETFTHLGYVRRRRDLPRPEPKFATAFIDYVTGVLPSTRLLLEKKIVVTTVGEARREYAEQIGGAYGRILEDFSRRHAGAVPGSVDVEELAAWYRGHFTTLRREADAITDLYLERLNR